MRANRPDLKTLTIGLLLGICLMLAKGAAEPARPAPPAAPRYQIAVSSATENGTTKSLYMHVLDHKDGSVRVFDWNATQWQTVDRMEVNISKK